MRNSKEQFEALEGVDGSSEVEIQRNQLSAQIKQIELQLEEAKSRAKAVDERNATGSLDLFERLTETYIHYESSTHSPLRLYLITGGVAGLYFLIISRTIWARNGFSFQYFSDNLLNDNGSNLQFVFLSTVFLIFFVWLLFGRKIIWT